MTAALPYALSVHHFISQVGDYVGFAAIIAVAIMVLLLFAHARETAELRRRAQDAEDELSVLHDQVQWLRDTSRPGAAARSAAVAPGGGAPDVVAPPAAAGVGRASGVPVPPPAGALVPAPASAAGRSAAALATGAGGAVAPVPAPASAVAAGGRTVVLGAPVGVGAPALSSATKLIPPTDEELRAVAAATAARTETVQATTDAAPGAMTAVAAGGGAAAGSSTAVATPPPPATAAAGGNGQPPRRTGIAADPGAPRGGGRPGQPVPVTSPRRNYAAGSERPGRRRISRTLIAAVTLLVIAIVVVAVIVLGGSSSKSHTPAASGQPSSATRGGGNGSAKGKAKGKATTVNVNPSTVTVAVLNGTQTANLAADVSSKLSARGFQQGATGNAADQSMSTTIVGYVPSVSGAKNDAYAVARTLGLAQTTVKPVSSANQTVACSSTPTNCPDQVIVTVGADLNSDAA